LALKVARCDTPPSLLDNAGRRAEHLQNSSRSFRMMDAVLVALPKLLFSSFSALPLALGMFAALRHLRAGSRFRYVQHLLASVAAGAAALALLWSSLYGDSLSHSSTAALIFAVAPFYAALAQGIVYGIVFGIAALIRKRLAAPDRIGFVATLPMLAPLLILAVFMFGIVSTAFEGNDAGIAQRSSDPATLHRLYDQSRSGEADAFSVPFSLAQNPNAPPDLLRELAKHEHPAVRAHVADNARTTLAVVSGLRYDCASFVRKVVVQRLGPDTGPAPATAASGRCALDRWR
jgi:hypothetical protein